MIVCIVDNLWGFSIVFLFQNPAQQDTSFMLLFPFYQERTEWKLFNLPPCPHFQHCWDDLMPHNRSNFVIMTQRQQLKNIACFRAYKLVVGNWQQNVFSNPLKWYLIASWHGNYCICTVPEEFQPEFDRELIKSPRCNWRFDCIASELISISNSPAFCCHVFLELVVYQPFQSPSQSAASVVLVSRGAKRAPQSRKNENRQQIPCAGPEWHHLKQKETCF